MSQQQQPDLSKALLYTFQQRPPFPGEPTCVNCSTKFGAYIVNESGQSVCSYECKLHHLEKTIQQWYHLHQKSHLYKDIFPDALDSIHFETYFDVPEILFPARQLVKDVDNKGDNERNVSIISPPEPPISPASFIDLLLLKRLLDLQLKSVTLPCLNSNNIATAQFIHSTTKMQINKLPIMTDLTFLPSQLLENINKSTNFKPTQLQSLLLPCLLKSPTNLMIKPTVSTRPEIDQAIAISLTYLASILSSQFAQSYNPSQRGPYILLITPTPTRATHLEQQLKSLMNKLPFLRTANLSAKSGDPVPNQVYRLQSGVQIIIGTPGRVQEVLDICLREQRKSGHAAMFNQGNRKRFGKHKGKISGKNARFSLDSVSVVLLDHVDWMLKNRDVNLDKLSGASLKKMNSKVPNELQERSLRHILGLLPANRSRLKIMSLSDNYRGKSERQMDIDLFAREFLEEFVTVATVEPSTDRKITPVNPLPTFETSTNTPFPSRQQLPQPQRKQQLNQPLPDPNPALVGSQSSSTNPPRHLLKTVKQTFSWVETPSKKKSLFSILNDPKYFPSERNHKFRRKNADGARVEGGYIYEKRCIVFVEHPLGVEFLAQAISDKTGINTCALTNSPTTTRAQRLDTLAPFKRGTSPILVTSSDVARFLYDDLFGPGSLNNPRGRLSQELARVDMVINFDLPSRIQSEFIFQCCLCSPNFCINTNGRSSKIEKGWAITFVNDDDKDKFKQLVKLVDTLPMGEIVTYFPERIRRLAA